jgi:uncharacterized protein (DUF2267 family)
LAAARLETSTAPVRENHRFQAAEKRQGTQEHRRIRGVAFDTMPFFRRAAMSANGLEVFDKTLQQTHIWLDEVMQDLGPDRQVAWHALGAVLHALRDRLIVGLAVHLGAQLPLLVRGLYYDQWQPSDQRLKERTAEEFFGHVSKGLVGIRPVNVQDATRSVFTVLNHHVNPDQVAKVRDALPEPVRVLWPAARDARQTGRSAA